MPSLMTIEVIKVSFFLLYRIYDGIKEHVDHIIKVEWMRKKTMSGVLCYKKYTNKVIRNNCLTNYAIWDGTREHKQNVSQEVHMMCGKTC